MNRFALLLVGLGFLLAATLVGCSQIPDTKPQAAVTPKAEAAPEQTFQTLILGKWRSTGPGPAQVWEFKKNGVVSLTTTITGTVQASEVIPKDEPITLGSIAQSGKYTFANDKLVRVALEEAKSKGMSVAAAESIVCGYRPALSKKQGQIGINSPKGCLCAVIYLSCC